MEDVYRVTGKMRCLKKKEPVMYDMKMSIQRE